MACRIVFNNGTDWQNMSYIHDFIADLENFAAKVRALTQDELECGCPEHVYEQIRILRGEASPGRTSLSIVVGERLLVMFGDMEKLEPFEYEMPRLILAGITYRDSIGLNRVRIILPERTSVDQRAMVGAEISKYDDRLHVHYLD